MRIITTSLLCMSGDVYIYVYLTPPGCCTNLATYAPGCHRFARPLGSRKNRAPRRAIFLIISGLSYGGRMGTRATRANLHATENADNLNLLYSIFYILAVFFSFILLDLLARYIPLLLRFYILFSYLARCVCMHDGKYALNNVYLRVNI